MYSAHDDSALPEPGFPIRKSPDRSLLSGSPKLIAASHVLHRLLAPRHPPYALSSLTPFRFGCSAWRAPRGVIRLGRASYQSGALEQVPDSNVKDRIRSPGNAPGTRDGHHEVMGITRSGS
jgi:hypothetical protein